MLKRTETIIISLLLVVVLIFSACGKDTELTAEPKGTDIVASIGDETITYSLYKAAFESYYQYMEMLGNTISSEQELNEYQDMILEYLLMDMLAIYNAEQDGFVLSEEKRAEAIAQAETELQDVYDAYMEYAESDYQEDPSKTVQEYFDEYISELSEYYVGEKLDFAGYSERYIDETIRSYVIEAYKESVCVSFDVSETDIVNWYAEINDSDRRAYSTNPEQFKFDQEYFEKYFGTSDEAYPVTYVPEGYSRIMDIVVYPSGTLSDEYKSKQSRMKAIYDEFSELAFEDALSGSSNNSELISSLIEEYRRLDQECRDMYDDYIRDARAKIDMAFEELENGADFADVMMRYSENDVVVGSETAAGCAAFQTKGQIISLEYECQLDWSDTVKEIFSMLAIGEYSRVFTDDDGSLHIIKYVSDIAPGDILLDDVREAVTYFVKADSNEEKWDELMQVWLDDPNIVRNMPIVRYLGKDMISEN